MTGRILPWLSAFISSLTACTGTAPDGPLDPVHQCLRIFCTAHQVDLCELQAFGHAQGHHRTESAQIAVTVLQ